MPFCSNSQFKNDLKDLGLKHIELMTNFKLQSKREPNDIVLDENKNISVCVLSRLTEDKGIEDAIEAVKIANTKLGNDNIHLDLYGIVPNQYQEKFDKIVKENENIVTYKGVANYNETASHLKNILLYCFQLIFMVKGLLGA